MSTSKYSKEFRADALRIAERDGVSAASEALGVPKSKIYDWRRTRRIDQIRQPKGLKAGESVEDGFHRLEKENDELREANAILKKAMGFLVGR
jgi:transposase